jgi:hypothetical protein
MLTAGMGGVQDAPSTSDPPDSIYLIYEKLHIKGALRRPFALGSNP